MSQIQRSDLQPEPSTVHALRENWPLPAAKAFAGGFLSGRWQRGPMPWARPPANIPDRKSVV